MSSENLLERPDEKVTHIAAFAVDEYPYIRYTKHAQVLKLVMIEKQPVIVVFVPEEGGTVGEGMLHYHALFDGQWYTDFKMSNIHATEEDVADLLKKAYDVYHEDLHPLLHVEAEKPKEPEYTMPVCRGAYALGTACGHCQRCIFNKPKI